MKNIKRIVSLLLVLIMVIMVSLPTFASSSPIYCAKCGTNTAHSTMCNCGIGYESNSYVYYPSSQVVHFWYHSWYSTTYEVCAKCGTQINTGTHLEDKETYEFSATGVQLNFTTTRYCWLPEVY